MSETNEQWADVEIDRLRAELAAKDARIKKTDAELIAVANVRDAARAENETLQNQCLEWMKVCTRKGEEHFLKELHRIRTENESLRKNLATQGDTVAHYRSKAETLRKDLDECENLPAEEWAKRYEETIEALRKRVEEFEMEIVLGKGLRETILANWRASAEQAEAKLAEAKEQAHYANGVADLAMKHRNIAEAERDALREDVFGERRRVIAMLEHEADLCVADVVTGDEIGRREANARAGALLTAAEDIRQGAHEACDVPQESGDKARAEQAEKRVAELEARDKITINRICALIKQREQAEAQLASTAQGLQTYVEALNAGKAALERAEAERDAMREALVKVRTCVKQAPLYSSQYISAIIDAALNPSPTGREG